jgi:predicted DNA-binding protein (UPF0251 family)
MRSENMKNINLNEMSIKSAVRLMMEGTEYKQFQEVAEALEIRKTTFQSALDNNSLRVRDLIKIAELLGYELNLIKE